MTCDNAHQQLNCKPMPLSENWKQTLQVLQENWLVSGKYSGKNVTAV